MNKEKELMQTGNSLGEYLAPSVKVIEIKARRVICGSQLDTEQNGSDSNAEDLNW